MVELLSNCRTNLCHASQPPQDGPGEELESFPIYMCVGPDELEAAIDAIPQAKHGDCILVNNGGFIEPILNKRAMCGQEQTQCVFYVTVNEYGVGFDQRVSLGPIGAQGPQVGEYAAETTVTGKWAGSLEERLARHNFFCRTMSYRDWRKVTTGISRSTCVKIYTYQRGTNSVWSDLPN